MSERFGGPNIAGLGETDPAKGHRYSRAFKEQMEMDGL
jgi:hypothetical protein